MDFSIDLLIGAAAGVAFIAVSRTFARFERALFAGGLLVAAIAYFGYGIVARPASELVFELAGSALFAALGALGHVSSMWFLATGWAAHAGWDLIVPTFADVSYMPTWYAAACVGFDVAVAAYLVGRASGALAIPEAATGGRAAQQGRRSS
jgi:hypothetical protein